MAYTFIAAPFKKAVDKFVCNIKPISFCRTILTFFFFFFCFPFAPLLRSFASHQNTTASLECSLMNSSILGPSTFMRSNASIFSSLNLRRQSLFTTFINLKNLSTISLGCRTDNQSSITRKIWGNFSLTHWYKIYHVLDPSHYITS